MTAHERVDAILALLDKAQKLAWEGNSSTIWDMIHYDVGVCILAIQKRTRTMWRPS